MAGGEGEPGIDLSSVPRHVAIVMDGNGRWARQRDLPRTAGHMAGEEALFRVIDAALEIGIEWFTVYAFSTENWRRPPDEVRFLMNFNERILSRHRDALNSKGVRIRFSGRKDWRVPRRIARQMAEAEELTAKNTTMTLTVCFNYGGRAEIIDAVRSLVADQVAASKIDERQLRARLYYPDMPDPDLIIRTSGEFRISNFLLWELAYSELIFSDVLWPDFDKEHLVDTVRKYQQRERRYGKVQR